MEGSSIMKFKNLGALFLLSLASIYFICPVRCTASPEAGGDAASITVSSHQQHRIASQTVDETSPAACCKTENQPTPAQQHHGDEDGHCCLNQWESLGLSEPQPPITNTKSHSLACPPNPYGTAIFC